ncbi:MAG: hypothetical protein A2498_08170 [Lentisphaerae bacterium RIFOXYC12_FULL_60_16]|nr:MAG: hypothetical protein A2498_08170 [Lentisphaerae bacterium RIFOXYC12_FULL_60_16]OGV79733.1 MAG: hypothetical protein A2340_14740 [Lentisphaerae bacterium RIFOXYB12_FULL_60_10]
MRHHKAIKWETTLKTVMDEIDRELEDRYGDRYPLHPARPAHGKTASRDADGLFDIGASFSAGFGSKHGKGYVLQIRMATLADVPKKILHDIQHEVIVRLNEKLPQAFPGRQLEVKQDGNLFKIVGDLSLGNV